MLANPSLIGDKLGLPLSSQTGAFDIYQVTASTNTTVFTSAVAPTVQGSVQQAGGATQTIIANGTAFKPPVLVGSITVK